MIKYKNLSGKPYRKRGWDGNGFLGFPWGGSGSGWGGPGGSGSNWRDQQVCSSVILAFPPTLDNLAAAGVRLTASENEVFSTVGVHNYFSSAVKFDLPFGVSYVANNTSPSTPPPSDGEPVAVLRLFQGSDIVTAWSWGPYRQFESTASAENLLKTSLSKINKDPRNATAMTEPVTQGDVRAFRKWDYFPHFDSPQLKDDFYEKYNALQGTQNTFYTSAGLSGMEIVEWGIRGAQDLVASHF